MKSGPALHKLAKHRIELLQQKLNEADSEAAAIQNMADNLENTIVRERALAAQSDTGFDFVRYVQALAPRRAGLAAALEESQERANKVRAELMDAFAEGKKIEILMERALQRERAEEGRIEQAQLDEMALRKKV